MKKQIGYVLLSCFLLGGAVFGIISLYILKPEGIELSGFRTEPRSVQILSIGTLLCNIVGVLSFFKSIRMEKTI